MFLIQFILCSLTIFIIHQKMFASSTEVVGPADVQLEGVEECDDPEIYEKPFNLVLKKVNRTHAGFQGCVTLDTDLDASYSIVDISLNIIHYLALRVWSLLLGDVKVNMTASKWGDGGWKPNAFDYFGVDVCIQLKKNAPEQFEIIAEHVGRDPKCPASKGDYCFENLVIALESVAPSMMYGKFRVDLIVTRNNKPYICARLFANTSRSKTPPKMKKY